MPNLQNQPWSGIVSAIPVSDHSIEVQARKWQTALSSPPLAKLFHGVFCGKASIRISRQRLLAFSFPTSEQKCLEIFMWGYPTGGRGNNRQLFIQNLTQIAQLASTAVPWDTYYTQLKGLGGLGISTISKLAYFHGIQFGGLPSLILDLRIIEVLQGGRWTSLVSLQQIAYAKAYHQYPLYLKTLDQVATAAGCTAEQIEFFLFALGDSF